MLRVIVAVDRAGVLRLLHCLACSGLSLYFVVAASPEQQPQLHIKITGKYLYFNTNNVKSRK